VKDGFVIRKPEKARSPNPKNAGKRSPATPLTPRLAPQIHSRYRAAKALEAKRKGRHSGTGACLRTHWPCRHAARR
jgi:hypothetical protein